MIINSTSLTGITSIFCTQINRKHLSFTSFFGYWTDNAGYNSVSRQSSSSNGYHGAGWAAWCSDVGQVAGSIVLQGGTSVDRALLDYEYPDITSSASSITLIDISCSMSYHAGGLNTAATHVYNFRAYNRIIYNSAGTPSIARNVYYGNGSGSGSLDTGNFLIVVASGQPHFRFVPSSSNTSTATMFNYVGQVVQSY